jgi:polysaccharide biosynthesis transport protein
MATTNGVRTVSRREESRVESSLDFRGLTAILRHRKGLILGIAIPVILLTMLYSYHRGPVYTATATLYVRPALSPLTQITRPTDISAKTEMNVATSGAVATLARQSMRPTPRVDWLLRHVSANMTDGTQVLSISFSAHTPSRAQQGAEAFANSYLTYRQQQSQALVQGALDADTNQLQAIGGQIQKLSAQLQTMPQGSSRRADVQSRLSLLTSQSLAVQSDLASLQTITTAPGEVINPASVPTSPSSPRHVLDLAIGVIVGLLLGVGAALIKDRSTNSVRTPADLEDALAAPVLASIPKTTWRGRERIGLAVARNLRTPTADAYRRLRTSLLSTAPAGTKTLLITSALNGEGKTTAVANLGVGLAEIGRRVIMISADLRRPALHRLFRSKTQFGVARVLAGRVSPSKAIQKTSIPNLRFVPTGALSSEVEPVNLLQREHMLELLAECSSDADFVLVDSPAVLGVPDSLVLAPQVDGVILVADARRARWEDVSMARDEIERAGGTVIAGLLNRTEGSRRNRLAWDRIADLSFSPQQRFFPGRRVRAEPALNGKRPIETPASRKPASQNAFRSDAESADREVVLDIPTIEGKSPIETPASRKPASQETSRSDAESADREVVPEDIPTIEGKRPIEAPASRKPPSRKPASRKPASRKPASGKPISRETSRSDAESPGHEVVPNIPTIDGPHVAIADAPTSALEAGTSGQDDRGGQVER